MPHTCRMGTDHQIHSQGSNSLARATVGEWKDDLYPDGKGARNPEQQASNACQQRSKGPGAFNTQTIFFFSR